VKELTNSAKPWFLLGPTLHKRLTTLPKGVHNSTRSSWEQCSGRFRKCTTFEAGTVSSILREEAMEIEWMSKVFDEIGERNVLWIQRKVWEWLESVCEENTLETTH